ncbi:hypothetical protein LIANG_13915 (plasmid) [Enterococcus durans]|nr:hypothetical protein LIANG_13915 [Enterococcus durans]
MVLFNICDIVKFFERSTKFCNRLLKLIQIFKFLKIILTNKIGYHLIKHYLRIKCAKKKAKGSQSKKKMIQRSDCLFLSLEEKITSINFILFLL